MTYLPERSSIVTSGGAAITVCARSFVGQLGPRLSDVVFRKPTNPISEGGILVRSKCDTAIGIWSA
jgi:hypothetical protein